ncbi:unnamed protein product [Musa acuminata subsp. malaccensis]|uniref:Exocyst subunit Exo70 family protein n=1 Tax=Musa acuminata subsp. malaccensis TaxID=214687 RepID=A0A804KFC8_MUSAM|nr:PREDICTED: exocyst complex component EXO70A1-like [Musa acuminata subsp. malaccensis]CAG1834052.1 unnamed protein product [Musa acuminata subsp. malaccensis]
MRSLLSSSPSPQDGPQLHHLHRNHRRPVELSPSRQTFSDRMMEDSIAAAEEVISKWGPEVEAPLFSGNGRAEADRFLRVASDLHRSMLFFTSPSANSAASPATRSAVLFRAQSLLSAAMRRLERELHLLLSDHCRLLDSHCSSSSDASTIEDAAESITEMESALDVVMRDLRAVAEAMISAGYTKECVRVYKTVSKSFIDKSIRRLGFERLTQSQVQKLDGSALESRIRAWLAAAPIAFRILFSRERLLCDRIFAGSDAVRESCFADVARDAAAALLAFPESAARSKRSPEKLFRILDLYDTLVELWPDIESLFIFESTAAVRSQAVVSLLRLAEVARSTLADFEAAIERDASRSPVPGGDVHPLTRYVMNYLVFLADYELALDDIFADFPLQTPSPLLDSFFEAAAVATSPTSSHSSPSSASTTISFEGSPWSSSSSAAARSISDRIAWLVLVLICKLDGKAELYREAALSYLFLANNIQYILRKVKESGLGPHLGDEWVARHGAKARHYAASYVQLAWAKVAAAIPADVSGMEAEERMRGINAALEAECRGQAGWVVVSDGGLREEVREAVAEMVVPAYRVFYERCRPMLRDSGAGSTAVVRFSPEDVSNHLNGIFSGSTGSGSSRNRVSGSSKDSNRSQ